MEKTLANLLGLILWKQGRISKAEYLRFSCRMDKPEADVCKKCEEREKCQEEESTEKKPKTRALGL